MTRAAVQSWYLVHKWTSLVCTAFLLLLCITGLPLIFAEEIGQLTGAEPHVPAAPAGTPAMNLDTLVAKARALHPADQPLFLGWDQHAPMVYVNLGPAPDAPLDQMKTVLFQAQTGEVLPAPPFNQGFMYWMFRLHTDMFAGLPGKLFLGAMGLLFVVAIVSGIVVYRPFMRKLDFGTVRRERSSRLKWLDLHNLLGIVPAAWLLIVGLTGVINTIDEPLYDRWQKRDVAALTGAATRPPLPATLASVDRAVAAAREARPERVPAFVSYPGTGYSGAHDYGVYMIGTTPVGERNYQPVLVNAATARLTGVPAWPLLLEAIYVTQPLHFGDYGGLPLKIVWAVLDVIAIVVLGSGLYLWLGRRGTSLKRRVAEVELGGVA